MNIKIGDIVNIVSSERDYWKGTVVEIYEKYDEDIYYSKPIIEVERINGIGHALVNEEELEFRDGEYWEK